MAEVVYTTRGKIERLGGPTRRVTLEGFPGQIYFGVHGGIKRFYNVEPKEEHPATLDYIVLATAA